MATTTYEILPDNTTAEDYLRQAQAAEIQAANANTQANLLTYQGQATTANQAYDKNAKQAYSTLLTGQQGTANALASNGLYNSGYADTYKINQQNAYGLALNENELARTNALRDIDTAQQQATLTGQSDIAAINANYNQMFADYSYQREQTEAAAKTEAEATALNNAYNAAEYGDFSQLKALGIDTTSAEKLYTAKVYSSLLSAYGGSSGGSSSGTTTKTTATADPIQTEKGLQEAAAFVRIYTGKMSAYDVLNKLKSQEASYRKLYGDDFYEAYKASVMQNFPGMSGYSAPEAEETTETYGILYNELAQKGSYANAKSWFNANAKDMNNDELNFVRELLADMKENPDDYFTAQTAVQYTGKSAQTAQ